MVPFSAQGSLPSIDELLNCTHVVAIPTRTRFRGVKLREAVLFDAPNRASEFSPFLEYDDAESAWWLAAAIEYGWAELPSARRTHIEVNATVPAVSVAALPQILKRFDGCQTVKVKVAEPGQSLAEDVARVQAIRTLLGDQVRIRIDANGAWSAAEAVTALRALAPFVLDYAEQPCASVAELRELRERLASLAAPPIRIAADESVRKSVDPLAVARAGAADLLIIKAQPLGGIARALALIEQAGLPVIVSSALDTSIGIGMGLRLAAALPPDTLAGACGLGTATLLRGDVTDTPLVATGGRIAVRQPTLTAECLHRYAAAEKRVQWWRHRIIRCYRLLTTQAFTTQLQAHSQIR